MTSVTRRTGIVLHERYYWHDPGPSAGSRRPDGIVLQVSDHAESPETKRRFHGLLEATGYVDHLVRIAPRAATVEEVARIHTRDYIAKVERMSDEGWGDAGRGAFVGFGTYGIALLSAGGAFAATDAVMAGEVDNAYALIRPPGHHATAEMGMGFCLFNNVALAVLHARHTHGVRRIAVVDWDVHHGNGTETIFWDDPEVLTISVHQDGRFPATTGGMDARGGEGAAFGSNLNVPLMPGCGHGAYLHAMDQVVVPALDRFRPELIFVACGFDAGGYDPMAHMLCHSGTFAAMAASVVDAATRLCDGRLVMVHEGGYSPYHVPFCGLAVLEEMSGVPSGVADPYANLATLPYQDLQPHQAALIARGADLVAGIPRRT